MKKRLQRALLLIIVIFTLCSIVSGYILFTDIQEYDAILKELNIDNYFGLSWTEAEFGSKFQIYLGKHSYLTISRPEFLVFVFSFFTFLVYAIQQFLKKFKDKITNIFFFTFLINLFFVILYRLIEFLKWESLLKIQTEHTLDAGFVLYKTILSIFLIVLSGTFILSIITLLKVQKETPKSIQEKRNYP